MRGILAVGLCLLPLFSTAAEPPVNVGVNPSGGFAISGEMTAFRASEFSAGDDLNRDGDTQDFVLHLYHAATGVLTNTGREASGGFLFEGSLVAVIGNEQRQRQDLNGDEDMNDLVLQVMDASTGAFFPEAQLAGASPRISGTRVAFAVNERDQGGTDLNGNGETDDAVLHVFDTATRIVTNLRLGTELPFELDGNLLAFQRPEYGQDLNNDGDVQQPGNDGDPVMHVYDIANDVLRNTGVASLRTFDLEGSLVAFRVFENLQGARDLNGDGIPTGDAVLHVYDFASDRLFNTGLPVHDDSSLPSAFEVEGNRVVFIAHELSQNDRDLGGHPAAKGEILHLFDLNNPSPVTSLGFDASGGFQVEGTRIVFAVNESQQGAGSLNSADSDSTDTVLHRLDLGSPAQSLALAVFQFTATVPRGFLFDLEGDFVAAAVSEVGQGVDLNGDGDISGSDGVLHVLDLASSSATNLRLDASGRFELAGGRIAFWVGEGAQGLTNFNGDPDTSDFVLHLHDTRTAVTQNLGLAFAGTPFVGFARLNEEQLAFVVAEGAQGQTDLTGDMDSNDLVLHVLRFTRTPVEQIEDLEDFVLTLDIHHGTENSLLAKLNAARAALDAGDTEAAIGSLQAFINHVKAQRGKKIDPEEADDLIAAAEAIIDALQA